MAIASPAPRVIADVIPRSAIANIALVVGGAAFVGIAAQVYFYLPWNPAVPVTLQTFAVLLTAGALGSVRGTLSMLVYAVLGLVGVPWFAEGSSGWNFASAGYIVGFIVAAFVVGRIAENGATRNFARSIALMLVGSVIVYVIGATWLKFAIDVPWFGADSAWSFGVKDFIVGDIIKLVAAAGLLPLAWAGLRKAGLSK